MWELWGSVADISFVGLNAWYTGTLCFAAYCVLLLGILRLASELCRKSSAPRHHEPSPDEGIALLAVTNVADTEQPSLPTHFDRSGGGLRKRFPSGGDDPVGNGSVQPKSMNVRLKELERIFEGGSPNSRLESPPDESILIRLQRLEEKLGLKDVAGGIDSRILRVERHVARASSLELVIGMDPSGSAAGRLSLLDRIFAMEHSVGMETDNNRKGLVKRLDALAAELGVSSNFGE